MKNTASPIKLPYDEDAEMRVTCAAFTGLSAGRQCINEVFAFELHHPSIRLCFEEIEEALRLRGEFVNTLSKLQDALQRKGMLAAVGGLCFLAHLSTYYAPWEEDVRTYIERVHDAYIARERVLAPSKRRESAAQLRRARRTRRIPVGCCGRVAEWMRHYRAQARRASFLAVTR